MTRDCQTPNPTTDTDSRRRSRSSDENTPALTAATGFVPAQPSAGPTADGERTMALTNAWAPAISTSWRPPKYLARAWPRPMCSISPNPCLRSKASISSRVNKVTQGSPNPARARPRRIHRRRIHRQDRPPDPVRRRHDPAGLHDLRKLRGKGPHPQARPDPSLPRPRMPPAPSPRYSPSAAVSSRPSWPGSAASASAAIPGPGSPSAAATRTSAPAADPVAGRRDRGPPAAARRQCVGQRTARRLVGRDRQFPVAALTGRSHPGCSVARSASAGSAPQRSPAVRRRGFLWAEPSAVGRWVPCDVW